MRATFEAALGLAITDAQWLQATLSISNGGLGFRSAQRHAAAAYLASRSATKGLRRLLDPAYVWSLDEPEGSLRSALRMYNSMAPPTG